MVKYSKNKKIDETKKSKNKANIPLFKKRKINFKRKSRIKKRINKRNFFLLGSENTKRKILLPEELLSLAESKLDNELSISSLKKAIEIYDINDKINYIYLSKCGKINSQNYKLIYTLTYVHRKNIIKKYNIEDKIFGKSPKILFYEFINFLLKDFNSVDNESIKKLENYKLECFERFIIPINEGTNELKYYYFIDVIRDMFNKQEKEEVWISLNYFSSFFENKSNLDKIEEIFYIIFRISLMFFDNLTDYKFVLEDVNCALNEDLL